MDEHRDGRRILHTAGPLTALCPFAPTHPLEVWFVPENPGDRFADASDAELVGLAELMPAALRAIEASVGGDVELSYTAQLLGAAEGLESDRRRVAHPDPAPAGPPRRA